MSANAGASDGAARKAELQAARDSLSRGPDGDTEAYAQFLDRLVCDLGRAAGWERSGFALAALGGYGRAEMAPFSDLDLLFLTASRPANNSAISAVLYPLWDLGLDVGHALRTPGDCGDMARKDLTVATALLDSRLLLGDPELLVRARAKAGIRSGGSREMRRWLSRILADVEARRARFGELSQLLEPHLKEGRGGLRDFQACRWALDCMGGQALEVPTLAPGGHAYRSWEFLQGVRNVLHGAAGRKTDHLTFEMHAEVAARAMPGASTERFFGALHRAGHAIDGAWAEICDGAREQLLPRRKRSQVKAALGDEAVLCSALLDWARSGDPLPYELRRALGSGSSAVAAAGAAAARRLLRSRAPLAPLLGELLRVGHLGAVLPELGEVAHQVHYDARHAFTTGVHCIETLRTVEDLWLGTLEREEPHLTRIAGGVINPAVLRVAALSHDLGKQVAIADHARHGAPVAEAVARRLGLDAVEATQVAELVERHHLLPNTAFGKDLEDPAAWDEVRHAARTPEALDTLLVLAFADTRATNPSQWAGVWSDWKRDLLLTLYGAARRAFGEQDNARRSVAAASARAASALGLAQAPAAWQQLPPREAAQVPPDLLAQLLDLAARPPRAAGHWHVVSGPRGIAEVLGVVPFQPHILSSAAGALAAQGMDILALQSHTWPAGTVHLWFRAIHPHAGADGGRLVAALEKGQLSPASPAPANQPAFADPRRDAAPVPVTVRQLEPDNPFVTVLEVRCRDRAGLLHDLTRAIEELGLSVEHSLVTTHGLEARDVFQLKDIFGGRIGGRDKLQSLIHRVRGVAEAASNTVAPPTTPSRLATQRSQP